MTGLVDTGSVVLEKKVCNIFSLFAIISSGKRVSQSVLDSLHKRMVYDKFG